MSEPLGSTPPARRYPATSRFPTGPAVGEAFPDVTLVDEHGDAIDLHTERAGRPAVVVFHRSAQWCAFCRRQLAQFQAAQPAYAAAGIAVFAVSPDPVPRLSEFAAEANITFPLLADEGSRLIRRLGILNDLIEPHEPRYGIPFPGVYVLAADGTVIDKYFYQHYRERPHPLRILREVFGRSAEEAGCIVATGHLGAVALRVTMLGRALTPYEHTLLLLRTDPPRAFRTHVDPDPRIEIGASVDRADTPSSERALEIWTTSRAAGAVDLGITFELGPSEVARIDVSVPIQPL